MKKIGITVTVFFLGLISAIIFLLLMNTKSNLESLPLLLISIIFIAGCFLYSAKNKILEPWLAGYCVGALGWCYWFVFIRKYTMFQSDGLAMVFAFMPAVGPYLILKIIEESKRGLDKNIRQYIGNPPYTKKCDSCNAVHPNEWKVCFYCAK